MIDLHCHILPGMDDGPAVMEESVEMARMAANDGIETIVATPHFTQGSFEWTAADISGAIGRLQAELTGKKIPVRLLPGADVAIFPELPGHPGKGTFLAINSGRYMLVEFPFAAMPPNPDLFLHALQRSGTIPIITHPERNGWFLKHPDAVYRIVEQGALVQITAMSILGGFGDEAAKFSEFLLRHRLVHVIASDGHSVRERPPVVSEAVRAASAIVGEELVRDLVQRIPAAIVAGKQVHLPVPVEHRGKARSWFGRLFGRGLAAGS